MSLSFDFASLLRAETAKAAKKLLADIGADTEELARVGMFFMTTPSFDVAEQQLLHQMSDSKDDVDLVLMEMGQQFIFGTVKEHEQVAFGESEIVKKAIAEGWEIDTTEPLKVMLKKGEICIWVEDDCGDVLRKVEYILKYANGYKEDLTIGLTVSPYRYYDADGNRLEVAPNILPKHIAVEALNAGTRFMSPDMREGVKELAAKQLELDTAWLNFENDIAHSRLTPNEQFDYGEHILERDRKQRAAKPSADARSKMVVTQGGLSKASTFVKFNSAANRLAKHYQVNEKPLVLLHYGSGVVTSGSVRILRHYFPYVELHCIDPLAKPIPGVVVHTMTAAEFNTAHLHDIAARTSGRFFIFSDVAYRAPQANHADAQATLEAVLPVLRAMELSTCEAHFFKLIYSNNQSVAALMSAVPGITDQAIWRAENKYRLHNRELLLSTLGDKSIHEIAALDNAVVIAANELRMRYFECNMAPGQLVWRKIVGKWAAVTYRQLPQPDMVTAKKTMTLKDKLAQKKNANTNASQQQSQQPPFTVDLNKYVAPPSPRQSRYADDTKIARPRVAATETDQSACTDVDVARYNLLVQEQSVPVQLAVTTFQVPLPGANYNGEVSPFSKNKNKLTTAVQQCLAEGPLTIEAILSHNPKLWDVYRLKITGMSAVQQDAYLLLVIGATIAHMKGQVKAVADAGQDWVSDITFASTQ